MMAWRRLTCRLAVPSGGARSILSSRLVLAVAFGTISILLWGSMLWGGNLLRGQQEPEPKAAEDPDEWESYLKVRSVQYTPASGGQKQGVRLVIDVVPEVPEGTKIHMELQQTGLKVAESVLQVKDRKKGILHDWVLFDPADARRPESEDLLSAKRRKPLPPGRYTLFTLIDPKEQTPAVRRAIERETERFPPDLVPWAHIYDDEKKIAVGTKAELAALEEKTCKVYDDLIAELIRNKKELDSALEEVKEGKKFVEEDVLDTEALKAFLKEWRKKQATTQRKILDLPLNHMAIHQRTLQAHAYLIQLGRMLSRYALRAQEEIEKKYGVEEIRVERDRTKKEDDILREFDAAWRYGTDRKHLNDTLDRIYSIACPQVAEEEDGEEGDGPGSGKKSSAGDGTSGSGKSSEKRDSRRSGGR